MIDFGPRKCTIKSRLKKGNPKGKRLQNELSDKKVMRTPFFRSQSIVIAGRGFIVHGCLLLWNSATMCTVTERVGELLFFPTFYLECLLQLYIFPALMFELSSGFVKCPRHMQVANTTDMNVAESMSTTAAHPYEAGGNCENTGAHETDDEGYEHERKIEDESNKSAALL
jgi:hypothetical protein